MSAPIVDLAWTDLALASALIGVNLAVSIALRLGMERTLAIATFRTLVQLTAVGFVLEWIFAAEHALVVLAMLGLMTVLAARASVGRTRRRYRGATWDALLSISVSAGAILAFALAAVVDAEPWWNPRYAIPILGMILGNSLTGISLGLDRFVSGVLDDRGQIELILTHGGTREEALRSLRADAVRIGMIPIINSMMVVGTVSLPGMMTGQILSGTDPQTAVAYQIVIMFLLAAATTLGTVGVVKLAERRLFDARDRPLYERILQK